MDSVAVLGDSFIDVYCPVQRDALPFWGGDVLLNGVMVKPGGSASNTCCQLASLVKELNERSEGENAEKTWRVRLHTALGQDLWAKVLVDKHESVGSEILARRFDSTGVCVVVSGSKDRAFMTSLGAMEQLAEDAVDVQAIAQAKHLHIGGYFSIPLLQKALPRIVDSLRELNPNLTVSLDTNFDALLLWGKSPCGTENHLLELINRVDFFLPNESEAQGISGLEDLDAALRFLAEQVRPGGVVVMTCGPDGVRAMENREGAEIWRLPAPEVQFVDSTGAGDAFNAGFLFKRVVEGCSFEEAAKGGILTGSHAVQYQGACDTLVTLDLLRK